MGVNTDGGGEHDEDGGVGEDHLGEKRGSGVEAK